MRPFALTLGLVSIAVALAACLGTAERPSGPSQGGGSGMMTIAAPTSRTYGDDPADAPDMTPAPDLAGLVDCWGKAVCDPTSMICIKYLTGHIGDPGPPRSGASCYAPTDGCPNGVFDCACIQADPSLSMYCLGTCVDNKNGTFTCYEKQPGQ